ncbi:MAG: glycosyltransferase [Bacteroidota bacterium]|nr:glycosyltransferase [Bacteroidota bacterium]
MRKQAVLFVVRSYSRTGALPIRFRQIAGFLARQADVHVLELTHRREAVRAENGVTIHSLEYSRPGKILNPEKSWAIAGTTGSVSYVKPLAILKRLIRSLLFPDSVVTEARHLRSEVLRLTGEYRFSAVVLSAFPFSVLLCAGSLRRKTEARVILDVGDPFYRNSTNGYFRDLLARRFERRHLKYVDRLVVSSEAIRQHYLANYNFLTPEKVRTVAMGITESLLPASESESAAGVVRSPGEPFRLVYAGQLYRKMREPFELYSAVSILNRGEGITVSLQMYGSFSSEFSAGFEHAEGIEFMGPVAHGGIAPVYRSADAIVFIDNAYGLQTPGKIFEVAFVQKPVIFIADRDKSPAIDFIQGVNHIVVVRNSSESIADAVRTIMTMNPVYPSAEKVREFLWEKRAEEYSKILNELAVE